MSETAMWLFPLAIAAVAGLAISARVGLRWTWGVCLQQSLILLFTALGFCFLYMPGLLPHIAEADHAASFCAWMAWFLFAIFNVGQRLVLNRLTVDLAMLRIQEANSRARWLQLFAWGPPGKYWLAMARAMALYAEGREQEADGIIAAWQSDSRVPAQARDSLAGFTMLGYLVRNDWQGITDQFLRQQHADALTLKGTVPLQLASRAFAEQGMFTESLACLKMVFAASTRLSVHTVDGSFIPFFALAGACNYLDALFQRCHDMRSFPTYSRLFWSGRCAGAQGDARKALQLLKEAKDKTPASLAVWHHRIDRKIAELQLDHSSADAMSKPNLEQGETQESPAARSAPPALVEEAASLYARWKLTADTVRPAYAGAGLKLIMVILVVAFVLSNPLQFFGVFVDANTQTWLAALQQAILIWGQLDWHLFQGQWWRIITSLCLHGNTAHLALNTGALYLFGRSVENMYGTARFCLIFLLAGVLSGWVQLVAMPQEPAIGASGAILGIFGAAIAGIFKLKQVLPAQVRKTELRWMLSIALLQVVFDQLVNNIAAATDKSEQGVRIAAFAHFGGIVAGFALGMLLPLRRPARLTGVDTIKGNG